MTCIVCQCVYKTFVDQSVTLSTTVLDFLLSIIIGVSGIMINYTFLKKLREEKRNTPLGRKGNVIEPIMRWFGWLQIFYWPYHLAFFFLGFNGIIPVEYMNGWWCNVSTQVGIKFGRVCIAYNSFFVALIRYIYIVHNQKANQWEFENVGKIFRVSSIAIPIGIETIGLFVHPNLHYQEQVGFKECVADHLSLNTTENMQIPAIYPLAWTLELIPELYINIMNGIYEVVLVVIYSNAVECFLYFQIHRSIQR